MDPLSQAVVGATVTQALSSKRQSQLVASIAGMLSGMAADIDVVFRSSTDPLLFLEFHRQFTHSLAFIPIGGLISAVLLYPFMRRHISFKALTLFTTLGYATHGLLDACTSYGTQLFWPFSNTRIAWDIIAIIDPLFTIPLLLLILAGMITKRGGFTKLGLVYGLLYLGLGVFQHQRALTALTDLSAQRGHAPERITAKPTIGNLILWKLVYEFDGEYYVDAVRLGTEQRYFEGHSLAKLKPKQFSDFSPLQQKDVERFRWFSDGYLAINPDDPSMIGDVRYSMLPNSLSSIWGIRARPDAPNAHVDYEITRQLTAEKKAQFKAMLLNQ